MDAPAVAVSADGKTIAVAWMDMRRFANERDVFWRLIRNGKPESEMPLATDQNGAQQHPALAVDEKGVVHAVWQSNAEICYRTDQEERVSVISDTSEARVTQPSIATRGKIVVVAYDCQKNDKPTAIVRRVN